MNDRTEPKGRDSTKDEYVPEELKAGLTAFELSELLRKRLRNAEEYGRRRRSQWRLLASLPSWALSVFRRQPRSCWASPS